MKLVLVHSKAGLEWAPMPFILASTGCAMDREVTVFFAHFGVQALLKDISRMQVTPLGNPSMVLKLPVGPDWFRSLDWNRILPDVVWLIPGMNRLCSKLFLWMMKRNGQASIEDLREICQEMGVKFIVCPNSMEMMGLTLDDLIDGVELAGAATLMAELPAENSVFI